MNVLYLTSAKTAKQLGAVQGYPEIAFIGRSNSGKSSLINALLRYNNLARKSRTPGRTQMANFFLVENQLLFVDLPGYGYSASGKGLHSQWQSLMQAYMKRPMIQTFVFLMDIRRDVDDTDEELLRYLSKNAPVDVVLTKADKINKTEAKKRQDLLRESFEKLKLNYTRMIAVSTQTKQGLDELRDSYLQFERPI